MQALVWIASGVLAGWLAGLLMRGRDYALGGNLILKTKRVPGSVGAFADFEAQLRSISPHGFPMSISL